MKKIVVLGGGGFIGGHLSKRLKEEGNHVRICDIKKHQYFYQDEICDEFILGDLTDPKVVDLVIEEGVDEVYQLAASISKNDSNIFYVFFTNSNPRWKTNTLIIHFFRYIKICFFLEYFPK